MKLEVLTLETGSIGKINDIETYSALIQPEILVPPVTLEKAQSLIMQYAKPVDSEKVCISSALGRVLYDDILAPLNVPPFNLSPLDGFAIRAMDVAAASPHFPALIDVHQEIHAGCNSEIAVGRNQAARIMTGAPLPQGADVVIKLEDVELTDNMLVIKSAMTPFENVCFAGEDIEQGEQALGRGELISPASIGVLATLGINTVTLFKQPLIAIIGNGDELVDVWEDLSPGKIYDSNSYALASNIQQLGAQPIPAGVTADNLEQIAQKILESLDKSDMVITTGGVSIGDHDLVKSALCSIGAKILFHRVAMRPGTPALGAVKDGKLIICLSGNKAASFVTFQLLVRPALAKLMGLNQFELPKVTALLDEHYRKSCGQRNLLRGQLVYKDNLLKVRITGKQNPGIISSTLNCNALIDLPANCGPLAAGSQVSLFLL